MRSVHPHGRGEYSFPTVLEYFDSRITPTGVGNMPLLRLELEAFL